MMLNSMVELNNQSLLTEDRNWCVPPSPDHWLYLFRRNTIEDRR